MTNFSWTNIILPVLFLIAAVFYIKLGYIAIVGCCDSSPEELVKKLKELENEIHGSNNPNGIDSKLSQLGDRLIKLQNEIINKEKQQREHIDFIRKEIEKIQTDGVTAGDMNKRSGVKDSLVNAALFLLLIMQFGVIFGVRHMYRKTKALERSLSETNDKKST